MQSGDGVNHVRKVLGPGLVNSSEISDYYRVLWLGVLSRKRFLEVHHTEISVKTASLRSDL